MKILVLVQYPLVSEMISMIIHRILPQARVIIAKSFDHLCKLAEDPESIHAVIIDPRSPGCHGFFSMKHLSNLLPDINIIAITDMDYKYSSTKSEQKASYNVVYKTSSVIKISELLQKMIISTTTENLNTNFNSNPNPKLINLSRRHRQLINLLGKGYNNYQISIELGISEHTVKVHFHRLYKILGVNSRIQALCYAKTHGWIFN